MSLNEESNILFRGRKTVKRVVKLKIKRPKMLPFLVTFK